VVVPGILDGLYNVNCLTHQWLARDRQPKIRRATFNPAIGIG
jgi:hypothetical protein